LPPLFGTALDGIPPELWSRARQAPHRLLLTDFDGTLAPFTVDRMSSRALPASRFWLDCIQRRATRTEVGIISGRPISEVSSLLDPWRGLLIGEHGWETLEADGRLTRIELDPEAEEALRRAYEVARRTAPFLRLERKRCSVVAHTRGMEPSAARALEARLAGTWRESQLTRGEPLAHLRLDLIDGGLELRAAGQDRALAIERLLGSRPKDALAVYLGDDESDEDAFRAVRRRGFGVRVGRSNRSSHALGLLDDPEAVSLFLAAWWFRVEAGAASTLPPPRQEACA
jgi:trehalose 6-phosphate phosphatase